MTTWLLWRTAKWIGLLALGYGVGGTVRGVGETRRMAALWVLPIGVLIAFISGFGMLEHQGLGFAEPWVLASLIAGVTSASGAALHATADRSRLGAGLAAGALLAAIGFMVFRDAGLWVGLVLGGLGAIAGAALATVDTTPPDVDAIYRWFKAIAVAEAGSLLFLFGIAMPAKYLAGHPELIAWTGWLHGVFFLLYVGAVGVGVLRLGWGLVDAGLGLAASMLPFGTVLFERRMTKKA